MKKILTIIAIVFASNFIQAQNSAGLNSSTFDGLQAGAYNPAALVGAIPAWEVNIVSANINVGNNYLYIKKLKGIAKDFEAAEDIGEKLNGKEKDVNLDINVMLPSFYVNIKEKNAFALRTNAHVITTIKGLDEDLAKVLYQNKDSILDFLPNFNDERISGAANAYASIDLTYARELFGKYNHKLSLGGTVSLLSPIFFASFEANNLNYSERQNAGNTEVSLNNTDFKLNVSDMFIDENSKYKFGITGFAFSGGVEYLNRKNCDAPMYKFRVGAALNNFGFLNYKYGDQTRHFKADGSYTNVNSISDSEGTIDNFDDFLDSLGTYEVPEGKFKVTTPASLDFYGDFKLAKNFYIFGSVALNPYSFKKGEAKASIFNEVQAVLRYENRIVGVYVPVGYNKYNGITSGAAFRLSFFSFGSKNFFSQLIKKEFTGLDFFFNLRFGDMRKIDYVKGSEK
jgi:long-subunit fatty acid transport protein